MKVKCLINNVHAISSNNSRTRLEQFIHLPDGDSDLEIGKTYNVQAIEFRNDNLWLYVHTVESNEYPFPYPVEFFQVEDSSLPTAWVASFVGGNGNTVLKRLTFAEWANNDLFFERLVDGDPASVATYSKLRQS